MDNECANASGQNIAICTADLVHAADYHNHIEPEKKNVKDGKSIINSLCLLYLLFIVVEPVSQA